MVAAGPGRVCGCRMNLYQSYGSNPITLQDPNGQFGIDLQYNAFIPKSFGVTAVIPTPYNWVQEPGPANQLSFLSGPISDWRYFFGTDDRENAGDAGTSRIHTDVQLDSTQIGNATDAGVKTKVWADDSHEAHSLLTANGPVIFLNEIKEKPGKTSSETTIKNFGTCCTDINVDADGAYPFTLYSPDIVIDVTWHLKTIAANKFSVSVSGKTSRFPAYEGIVNGNLISSSRPAPGSGPTLWNLGHFRPKQTVTSTPVTLP